MLQRLATLPKWLQIAIWVVIAAVLLALPAIDRNGSHFSLLTDAGVYVLLALGLNIVVGFAGLLDLGYAAFFAIGSYSYAMLASPQFNLHIPFWPMLFIASGIAATAGLLLGAPTLRLRGDYLAIVTLGFGEIVPQTFLNLNKYTGGPNGISSLDTPSFFGHSFGFSAIPYYYVILALIGIGLWLAYNLRDSRLGRAWMAIREDELAAKHMGINATTTKLAAFAFGASFSGMAGCVFASKLNLVSPDSFQFSVSVLVLAMLVLGGMGNIPGVIVGSLVLFTINFILLPQANNIAASVNLHIDFTNSRFFIYGVILVSIMLFKPEGLIPSGQRRAELRAGHGDPHLAAQEQAQFTKVGAD